MIKYEHVPLNAVEQARVSSWLGCADAELFRQCVHAQMAQHYLDAINEQAKAKTKADAEKFNKLAEPYLERAAEVNTFLRVFEILSDKNYSFHRIKPLP